MAFHLHVGGDTTACGRQTSRISAYAGIGAWPNLKHRCKVCDVFVAGARHGWLRAAVFYVDLAAEENPDIVAAMDERFPLPPAPTETADPLKEEP